MVFLWCGRHIPGEEQQNDPMISPVLVPCRTIECSRFSEDRPFCIHLVTAELPAVCEPSVPYDPFSMTDDQENPGAHGSLRCRIHSTSR